MCIHSGRSGKQGNECNKMLIVMSVLFQVKNMWNIYYMHNYTIKEMKNHINSCSSLYQESYCIQWVLKEDFLCDSIHSDIQVLIKSEQWEK